MNHINAVTGFGMVRNSSDSLKLNFNPKLSAES